MWPMFSPDSYLFIIGFPHKKNMRPSMGAGRLLMGAFIRYSLQYLTVIVLCPYRPALAHVGHMSVTYAVFSSFFYLLFACFSTPIIILTKINNPSSNIYCSEHA